MREIDLHHLNVRTVVKFSPMAPVSVLVLMDQGLVPAPMAPVLVLVLMDLVTVLAPIDLVLGLGSFNLSLISLVLDLYRPAKEKKKPDQISKLKAPSWMGAFNMDIYWDVLPGCTTFREV